MEEAQVLIKRLGLKIKARYEEVVELYKPYQPQVEQAIEVVGKGSVMVIWVFVRLAILSIVAFFSSAFIYGCIYWFMIPTMEHDMALYFNYGTNTQHMKSSQQQNGDLPVAMVDLFQTDRLWEATELAEQPDSAHNRLLTSGQSYELWVVFNMPESPLNLDIGMFMVNLELQNADNEVLARCSRPAVLDYRSSLLRYLDTLTFSVPLVLGWTQPHTQTLQLRCFEGYVESKKHPVRYVKTSLSHPGIQLYSSSLRIHAVLNGISYYIYHWWLTGITVIITQLMAVQMVFWTVVYLVIIYTFDQGVVGSSSEFSDIRYAVEHSEGYRRTSDSSSRSETKSDTAVGMFVGGFMSDEEKEADGVVNADHLVSTGVTDRVVNNVPLVSTDVRDGEAMSDVAKDDSINTIRRRVAATPTI